MAPDSDLGTEADASTTAGSTAADGAAPKEQTMKDTPQGSNSEEETASSVRRQSRLRRVSQFLQRKPGRRHSEQDHGSRTPRSSDRKPLSPGGALSGSVKAVNRGVREALTRGTGKAAAHHPPGATPAVAVETAPAAPPTAATAPESPSGDSPPKLITLGQTDKDGDGDVWYSPLRVTEDAAAAGPDGGVDGVRKVLDFSEDTELYRDDNDGRLETTFCQPCEGCVLL